MTVEVRRRDDDRLPFVLEEIPKVCAIALASAIPAIWYGWIYSVGPARKEWLDTLHLLLGHSVAGMIIGGWQ